MRIFCLLVLAFIFSNSFSPISFAQISPISPAAGFCDELGGTSLLLIAPTHSNSGMCKFGVNLIGDYSFMLRLKGVSQEAVKHFLGDVTIDEDDDGYGYPSSSTMPFPHPDFILSAFTNTPEENCVQLGGLVLDMVEDENPDSHYSICRFKDYSEIEVSTLARGAKDPMSARLLNAFKRGRIEDDPNEPL